MVPHKSDIGAVYTSRPKDHKMLASCNASKFQPTQRELVFDIDMTDYDDVRFCCTEADICRRCWQLMRAAVHILDAALREDWFSTHPLGLLGSSRHSRVDLRS